MVRSPSFNHRLGGVLRKNITVRLPRWALIEFGLPGYFYAGSIGAMNRGQNDLPPLGGRIRPSDFHPQIFIRDNRVIIDADSGKTLADIPGQKHNHGVALVPEVGRGFISDGDGAVVIFDLKTNAVLGTLAAQPDADGIIFDKATGLVLVVSGDNGVLMTLKPDVDPKTGSIDAPIDLGGKPEFLASDGAGKVYINLEDKDQVAVVDINARKVFGSLAGRSRGLTRGAIDRHREAAAFHWMSKAAEADCDEH
jgi:hypothetical protein